MTSQTGLVERLRTFKFSSAGWEPEKLLALLDEAAGALEAAVSGVGVKARAQTLVDKLNAIAEDEKYRTVWVIHQLHNGPYTGPTYSDEKEALEEALASMPPPAVAADETISAYEFMAQEFDRLAIMRKMWSAQEVAATIRRMAIPSDERRHPDTALEVEREPVAEYLAMHTGLIERLKAIAAGPVYGGTAAEAITAIERAKSRIAALTEALEPFAAIANEYADQEDDNFQVWKDFDVLGAGLPLKHFRRARAASQGVGA